MSEEQMNDSKFSRLFIGMLIAMGLLAVVLMFLAFYASNDMNGKLKAQSEAENKNSQAVADRIAPVGHFSAEADEDVQVAAAPAEEEVVLSGEDAYNNCASCHDLGIAGAPKLGDKAAWSARIEQGIDTLYDHAINGFAGAAGFMPARGGAQLSDGSVKAAVDYIVENSK